MNSVGKCSQLELRACGRSADGASEGETGPNVLGQSLLLPREGRVSPRLPLGTVGAVGTSAPPFGTFLR